MSPASGLRMADHFSFVPHFESHKATSNNWFRSENEDLRMDGKALEVSSNG
jgi:hypothetical protein